MGLTSSTPEQQARGQRYEISVIIPVTRSYLIPGLLDELARQEFRNDGFEVILVGEPSPTPPEDTTNCFSVQHIPSPSRHPSVRRNLGVFHARGRILAFIDDDLRPSAQWLKRLQEIFAGGQADIVCGPEESPWNDSFSQRMSNVIVHARLGDIGIQRRFSRDASVPFNEIPLCNCAMTKEVFSAVGGFNERADYNVDDTEFFFIADKLGFRAKKEPSLNSAHRREPFPLHFMISQFKKRVATGRNIIVFPEIFFSIPYTKPLLLLACFLPGAVILFPRLTALLLIPYAFILVQSSYRFRTLRLPVRCLLPFGLALNHIVTYLAIVSGLFWGSWEKFTKGNDYSSQRNRIMKVL